MMPQISILNDIPLRLRVPLIKMNGKLYDLTCCLNYPTYITCLFA